MTIRESERKSRGRVIAAGSNNTIDRRNFARKREKATWGGGSLRKGARDYFERKKGNGKRGGS